MNRATISSQPWLGTVTLIFILLVTFGIISLLDYSTFMGWGTYLPIAATPIQILIVAVWQCRYPSIVGSYSQPRRGAGHLLSTVVLGGMLSLAIVVVFGRGSIGVSPMAIMYAIMCILAMLWILDVWELWPFRSLESNRASYGLVIVAASCTIAALMFWAFFDFTFLDGVRLFDSHIKPSGYLNAWSALALFVTFTIVTTVFGFIENKPLAFVYSAAPALQKQPWRGLAKTILYGGVTLLLWHTAIERMQLVPLNYLVWYAYPFLLAMFIVRNVYQTCFFPTIRQPLRGGLNLLVGLFVAYMIAVSFRYIAQGFSASLHNNSDFQIDLWVASAILSIALPVLFIVVSFFDNWPLRTSPPAK